MYELEWRRVKKKIFKDEVVTQRGKKLLPLARGTVVVVAFRHAFSKGHSIFPCSAGTGYFARDYDIKLYFVTAT